MVPMYVHWNVSPEMCNIFGIPIGYYSLLLVSGLIISLFSLYRFFLTEKIPLQKFEKLCYYLLAGIFIGARLGHCLFYEPSYYLNHWVEIFLPIRLTRGGYVFSGYRGIASHGAAIGVVLVLCLYSYRYKIRLLKMFDFVMILAPLCGFFIRIGNLMNSEIIGIPTQRAWAFIFERVDSVPRHPVQLYEALAYLFTFLLTYLLYIKKRDRYKVGTIAAVSSIIFFGSRFFIEFLKVRQEHFNGGLSLNMGQLLSVPFVIAGLAVLIYNIAVTPNSSCG